MQTRVVPEDVRYLSAYLGARQRGLKTQARRAVLAFWHGGRCYYCNREVQNYGELEGFEFDHIYDVFKYKLSPKTGIYQFRISGSDCSNRSWTLVKQHGLKDCRLVCTVCHIQKTGWRRRPFLEKYGTLARSAMRAILGQQRAEAQEEEQEEQENIDAPGGGINAPEDQDNIADAGGGINDPL